jgi:hypothetical protein
MGFGMSFWSWLNPKSARLGRDTGAASLMADQVVMQELQRE